MSPFFAPAISIHATAAVLALLLAVAVMVRPVWMRPSAVRSVWVVLMVTVVVLLAVAVAVGWPAMDGARRLVDLGLVLLAAYTLLRAVQAAVVARRGEPGWGARLTEHLGFAAISLFDGFVIIAALRAGFATWAVVAVGAAGVAAGIAALNLLKRRPSVAAL